MTTNRFLLIIIFCTNMLVLHAQTDKSDSDRIIDELLSSPNLVVRNWHESFEVSSKDLEATNEEGIWLVKGKSFQIKSLSSAFYVRSEKDKYVPVFNSKYPLESLTNLLLNHIDNKHTIQLIHHVYGNKKVELSVPMQILYDVWGEYMDMYCSVTSIDKEKTEALLVFHHPSMNFIHLLDIKIDTFQITNENGIVTADLYTNIPQNNIKSLIKK